MKALYNTLIVLSVLVVGAVGWNQYEDRQHLDDDAYNAQCPNPTHEYFDCEWWPKKE